MSARTVMPTALALAGRTAPKVSASTPAGAIVTFACLYYVVRYRR